MSKRTTKSKGRKRPKEVINSFFAWKKVYLEHLFERPEVKKNMRLFGLAYYLSDHFDWEDYSCWPSRETIAEAIGVEVRTVSTLTNKLAEMGFLRVKRRGPDMSALYIGRLPNDVQSNAHQEAQSNACHGSSPDGLKRNPTSLDAQLNCNQTCNGLHPNDSDERSLEREGAAQAAPHQGRNNNSDSREPVSANADRSPIGEEEDCFTAGDPSFYGREDFTADEAHSVFAEAFEALCENVDDPSVAGHDGQHDSSAADSPSFADEDEFVADEDDFIADDDDGAGGIPYDAKSEDHPERQGAQPLDTPSDLLTRCLRREQYLTGGDRRRLHVILASFRGGEPIADADLDALTVILARLEGGDEFADDLSAIEPDLSEPTTATAAATEIWRQ